MSAGWADLVPPEPLEQAGPGLRCGKLTGDPEAVESIESGRGYLSVGSAGSVLSIGSAGSILSIGSVASCLSVLSAWSNSAVLGWRSSAARLLVSAAALAAARKR